MIRALDRGTGQVRWDYDIRKDGEQSQFHGDSLIADGLVLIGTDGTVGHVYAFEAASGAVRWKYEVRESGVASDILRVGEDIYFVTLGDELVCLELATGKRKWGFHASSSPVHPCVTCASPAISEGHVYFGASDGFVYAIDARSGQVQWKRGLGGSITTSVLASQHSIYLGTAARHLYRLDTESGAVLNDVATESTPSRRLVLAGNSVLIFVGNTLIDFSADLKTTMWSAKSAEGWTSGRPYCWRDLVLVGDNRDLVALQASNGSRSWSVSFPGVVRGVGTSPQVLYVGTLKGPIFAYAPKVATSVPD